LFLVQLGRLAGYGGRTSFPRMGGVTADGPLRCAAYIKAATDHHAL